jgi:hypothetical protein
MITLQDKKIINFAFHNSKMLRNLQPAFGS